MQTYIYESGTTTQDDLLQCGSTRGHGCDLGGFAGEANGHGDEAYQKQSRGCENEAVCFDLGGQAGGDEHGK